MQISKFNVDQARSIFEFILKPHLLLFTRYCNFLPSLKVYNWMNIVNYIYPGYPYYYLHLYEYRGSLSFGMRMDADTQMDFQVLPMVRKSLMPLKIARNQ